MVLYSDYWFTGEKDFFIYFPWFKYKQIFVTGSLLQYIPKLILFPLFVCVLIIDLFRILLWNLTIRPIYIYRFSRGILRDWIMDLNIDNPLNLPILLLFYPALGVLWLIEAQLHVIIILPIHLFSLMLNGIELFMYQIYTLIQQHRGIIEKRPFQFSAKSSSRTHTGFSMHTVGGKNFSTSYKMSKVKNLAKYIPIVGMKSMN